MLSARAVTRPEFMQIVKDRYEQLHADLGARVWRLPGLTRARLREQVGR